MHKLNPLPIFKRFFADPETVVEGRVMFTAQRTLYSFGLHVPIAVYFRGCYFCFPSTGSDGTRLHTTNLRDYITAHPQPNIYWVAKPCPTWVQLRSEDWVAAVKKAIAQRTREINAVLTSRPISEATRQERSAELRSLMDAWAVLSKKRP